MQYLVMCEGPNEKAIIDMGLFKEYNKVKNKISPKSFAKKYVMLNRERYNNSTAFWRDIDLLVRDIKEYKKFKKTGKFKRRVFG